MPIDRLSDAERYKRVLRAGLHRKSTLTAVDVAREEQLRRRERRRTFERRLAAVLQMTPQDVVEVLEDISAETSIETYQEMTSRGSM